MGRVQAAGECSEEAHSTVQLRTPRRYPARAADVVNARSFELPAAPTKAALIIEPRVHYGECMPSHSAQAGPPAALPWRLLQPSALQPYVVSPPSLPLCSSCLPHPPPRAAFEYAVKNALFHLGPDWGLYVYHGASNAQFVRHALAGVAGVQARGAWERDAGLEQGAAAARGPRLRRRACAAVPHTYL